MKQVLQNFKTGELKVEEIPSPIVKEGQVLVRNHFSLISTGTEGGTVQLGKMSLLGKAKARPDQVKKVIQVARNEGVMTAYNAAMRSLDMPIALGYCSAGEVIEIGEGVKDLEVGDLVACGGGGYANHAELVSIPRNLCVPIPENVNPKYASFCTLGSIAMQGVRISNAKIGENVVVIGLGLVGLLTCQLLKAAGCNVLGIDMSDARVAFANEKNYCTAIKRDDANLNNKVEKFSGGHGADSIIITAAAPNSNDPIALAGELARYKARVVVVGRTKMEAPRETYLFKELELCTSYAYGPGTGDPSYEEDGHDYPIGYVRWTENRNMQAFLQLIASGSLDIETLISHEFKIDQAETAFDIITGKTKSEKMPIGVVLEYPLPDDKSRKQDKITLHEVKDAKDNLKLGVIGAGSFTTNIMMPVLSKIENITLHSIASASGVRAKALGEKYGFHQTVADAEQIINDPEVDCVFILARHDTHAPLATKALNAGKHVFVEKPLALTFEELKAVKQAQLAAQKNLMVGFNRRYAALSQELKESFAGRTQPLSINFRANVGYRPPEHWLHHPKQGGGVILGEACHHIDFCCWMTDSAPVNVSVQKVGPASGVIPEDNVNIQITFEDGSIANVSYLSNGSTAFSRERVEVFGAGISASLEDFKHLVIAKGSSVIKNIKTRIKVDKGFEKEVADFIEKCRAGEIIQDQFHSSQVSIEAALNV